MTGLRAGGHLEVFLLWSGLWSRSVRWFPCSYVIPQVSGWCSPALVSSLGSSSKVTHCLSYMGLGDWDCLLVDSPWHDATWVAFVWQLPVLNLHQWLPKCLWLPECQQPWLREWLNLSLLSSSSARTTSACQWASLTTAGASSQEPHVVSLSWSG